MNKIIVFPFVALIILNQSALSQEYRQTDQGLKTSINKIDLEIQFFTPEIVRVIKSPEGFSYTKKSLSVTKIPEKTALKVSQKNDVLSVSSKSVEVNVNQKTGQIIFCNAAGDPILSEKEAGVKFIPAKDLDKDTFTVSQSFQLQDGETIYGLGQHRTGKMNQRNQKITLKQANMEIALPLVHSVKGYALFWDNYSTTVFDDNPQGTSFSLEVGDCADYYFIYGGNADKVIAGYRDLTGQAPMFPRWVFGFFQSKERYKSQDELLGVVEKYRELKVPLDGIVQDWQYWGADNKLWNSTEFGNTLFPDPKKMIDRVHELNAHIIISVWPAFGNKTKIFQELQPAGMLYDFVTWPITPDVQVYDAFNPKARDIYWKYMNQGIFSLGMDGWWLDATEPEHQQPKPSDEDNITFLGSYRRMRNAFPLATTGGVYDHQRQTTSDKRVFILTRSAFAGQQRYATMMWSGDVQSRWDVLRAQISGGVNLSMCGIPYWNSDIGGFFPQGKYTKGVKDPAFQELYVRWFQFGALCPMFRSHGTDTPREIFQFGKKGYWAYDAQEKFMHLRYRLLPYIYSNAWAVTSEASTLMRALAMDYPRDEKVLDINNEYMFGKSLLVCPVTDAMYTTRADSKADTVTDFSKIKSQKVYLPKGSEWFDFWSGEKLGGGQDIQREAPIDIMPLFVKAGSILPLGPFQQYTGEKDASNLEVRIYEGADGTFTIYEDENDNYNYEKGIYSTITLNWNDKEKKLTIGERKGSFPGMLNNRTFKIVLVGKNRGHGIDVTETIDRSISYQGKEVETRF
jgi:alpha-D-xyloside xylohydrolase